MTKLAEIQSAILQLDPAEREALRHWLHETASRQRIRDSGLTDKPIETIIEYDEGCDPVATRAWESV